MKRAGNGEAVMWRELERSAATIGAMHALVELRRHVEGTRLMRRVQRIACQRRRLRKLQLALDVTKANDFAAYLKLSDRLDAVHAREDAAWVDLQTLRERYQ